MNKQEKQFSSMPSGNRYLSYFKTTPFLENGASGYRKQHRVGLTDDCHKYYGAVRTQNESHNEKAIEGACETAIVLYNEIMEDGLKVRYRDEGTIDEREMQTLHDYSLQKALEKFQSTAKLGPEHICRDNRERILEKCKIRFDVINAENEERNKQAIEKAKEKSFVKYKAYVDAIIKVRREIGESIADHELTRVHEEAMKAAMGMYDFSSVIGKQVSSNKREAEAQAIEWWN